VSAELETQQLLSNIGTMTHEEMASLMTLLDELDNRKRTALARSEFLAFIAAVDPAYKFGVHLKRLGALLMQVEEGVKDRIAVSMAPRFGKSQMISIYYPAWYLGKHPDHKLIVASHTVDLAVDMARKVRNLMQTPEYKSIFPGVQIAADAKAAGKWNTTKGGEVYATGVGGALAGRGAHLIVVDDPISEQDIKAGNTTGLDGVYEWFRAGLRTRLMPAGKICVLHCLVGDTQVTLAAGGSKAIRDIRPDDMVASYDNGDIRPAKVLGWSNQGLDRVYAVALRSGVIIRGNERHPLLVRQNGVDTWTKIKDLQVGKHLVCVTRSDAIAHTTPAESANTTTTRRVEKRRNSFLALAGVSGAARRAVLTGVARLHTLRDSASNATPKQITQSEKQQAHTTAPRSGATHILKCSMGSLDMTTTACLLRSRGDALYAGSLHMPETPPQRGRFGDWLLTTATQLAKSGHSFATHATSSLLNAIRPSGYAKPLSTLSTTLDEIVAITPDGVEEVYDIQVEGTENFIANGVVSHNTRWHQRDLIGRLLKDGALNEDGDQYEMFEFPAILEGVNPKSDPAHAEFSPEEPATILKSLWPAQWSIESLLRTKASMPAWQWNAQYQQNPTAQESAIIKKDDIQWWPHEDPPSVDFIVQAYDTALTTKTRSDYSVCVTFGVWTNEEGMDNIICLNCVRGKWEFPELKQMALQQAQEWEPDAIIVEAKASGQPLIDEMRRSGLFVQDYSPGKGQDKIARMNSVSDMFTNKQVWFPEIRWATEVVNEILAFPAGEHDDQVDACLEGDTLILMGDGTRVAIRDVQIGNYVATPYGPKRVLESGKTGIKQTRCVPGTTLRATGNHPVATDRGWVRADQITPNDGIVTVSTYGVNTWLSQKIPTVALNQLCSMDTGTTDTQSPCGTPDTTRGQGGNPSIAPYGKKRTGPSPQRFIFTTRTMMWITTQWKTLSICLAASTWRNTALSVENMANQPNSKRTWSVSGHWPLCGTNPKQGVLGIGSRLKHRLQKLKWSDTAIHNTLTLAKFVLVALRLRQPKRSFAALLVGESTITPLPALETLRSEQATHASIAALVSWPQSASKNTALLRARPQPTTPVGVYNLSVEDAECYFANDILVHNCTLALIRIRKGGLIRLNSDVPDTEQITGSRRAAYY